MRARMKGHFKEGIDVTLLSATLYGTVNHVITTQSFYRKINNLESLGQEEFDQIPETNN